jgi:hypothetical protein
MLTKESDASFMGKIFIFFYPLLTGHNCIENTYVIAVSKAGN